MITAKNPATGETIKEYPEMDNGDVDLKILKATMAQKSWEKTPVEKRAELLLKASDVLLKRKDEFAKLMAVEMGKPISQGRAEIEKCAKTCVYYAGKGQSYIKTEAEVDKAWHIATTKSRTETHEIIVEEFINFDSEITLLTVTQKNGETLFCPPIGHRQERGDYQESWQPTYVEPHLLKEAQEMARIVTNSLTGFGIWGVEFFLSKESVWFSELSPRPHDTGMVTLAGTQNLSEFELHARAILGLPIPEITLERAGVSAVILALKEGEKYPQYSGIADALQEPKTDIRIFGKPVTREYRRMGVALAYDNAETDIELLKEKAKRVASLVNVS